MQQENEDDRGGHKRFLAERAEEVEALLARADA